MVREHIENALEEIKHFVEEAPAETARALSLVKTKLDEAELWLTKAEQITNELENAAGSTATVSSVSSPVPVDEPLNEGSPDPPPAS